MISNETINKEIRSCCNIDKYKVLNRNSTIEIINGGANESDIQAVYITDSYLNEFPKFFEKFLSIIKLKISSSGFGEVEKLCGSKTTLLDINNSFLGGNFLSLSECVELTKLSVTSSNLETIEWKNANKLIQIKLFSNKINEIPEYSFSSMENLEEVDFHENQITHIDGDLFKNNPKLKKVDFSKNNLKTVGSDIFDGNLVLSNLKFVNSGCMNKWGKNDFPKFIEELTTSCAMSPSTDAPIDETTIFDSI